MKSHFPFRSLVLALALLILTGLAPQVRAEEGTTGPFYGVASPSRMSRKLFRGVGNVVFGFMELPLTINREIARLDPVTGAVTGTIKGTARTAARMGVGAFEVVTFPIPTPRDYRPIIKPEFVMQDERSTLGEFPDIW